MTGIAALKRAKQILGSEAAVAEAVGVKQPSVNHILNNAKRVPAEWCLAIERATQGRVTRNDLRPDLYPRELEPPELAEPKRAWHSEPSSGEFYGGIRLRADGSALIPASVLAEAGLRPGDSFVTDVAGEGDVRLLSGEAAIRRAQELVRQFVPENVDLVEELMNDRRRQAERESRLAGELDE